MITTTIENKRVDILKKGDIEKDYTVWVNQYLNNGFHFYFNSGHQGEISKTFVTKDDKTVFCIYIDRETEKDTWNDVFTIYIKRFDNVRDGDILWLNKGETLLVSKYYQISRKYSPSYVNNKLDFDLINKIKKEKSKQRELPYYQDFSDAYKGIAWKILKKKKGFKSIKKSEIEEVTKERKYYYAKVNGRLIRL